MTDIVERLRAYRHGDAAHPDVMREAADEILRMRAALVAIRDAGGADSQTIFWVKSIATQALTAAAK